MASFEYLNGPLFDMDGTWDEVADLDWGAEYHYLRGYQRAAALVASAAVGQRDADQFVYPVVFLYRHAIELLLKRLIQRFEPSSAIHDIAKLWETCRLHLETADIGISAKDLDIIGVRLLEFHAMDKPATGFRYPYRTTADPDAMPERSVAGSLNLPLFAKRAGSLCEALEACDTAIHENNQARAEFEEYMRREAEYYRDDYYQDDY